MNKFIRYALLSASGLLILFTAALIFLFGGEHAEKEEEKNRIARCSDTDMAFIMSQKFVKKELKAPDDARFPSALDRQVSVINSAECKFHVRAFVDAKNSLNATIRTPYEVDMEYDYDKKLWGSSNLKIN